MRGRRCHHTTHSRVLTSGSAAAFGLLLRLLFFCVGFPSDELRFFGEGRRVLMYTRRFPISQYRYFKFTSIL